MQAAAIAAALSLSVPALSPAQPPTPSGPPSAGLVVGSGNFFSPIVHDLDEAVAFYRDGLGLEVQGEPGNAEGNAPLRDMFGLPDARLRWMIARPPGMTTGVEIVEISGADGKPLDRRVQDPGAVTLIVFVRDLDATLARVKALGAPVVSSGEVPATLPFGTIKARMVMVKDLDDHFVELVQPEQMPATQAAATANVVDVRVRLTVADVEPSMRLYHDALGLEVVSEPQPHDDAVVSAALGVSGAQYRFGIMRVPSSGLIFEVMDYDRVDRRQLRGRLQDPGSTRMQLRVRDVGAAIAAFEKFGGTVVSTGGKPLELPVPNGSLEVAIVREPDNLFLVLIGSPPPQ
jgi:catechol 2,3-dioxygenase-like lactoylglutathione lyase family enzyme